MNIPGANLLSMASRVIRFETIGHRAFVSRTANAAGDFVSTFAASVDIQGSMQPLNKKTYQELGLNLTKNYVMLYTSATVTPVSPIPPIIQRAPCSIGPCARSAAKR